MNTVNFFFQHPSFIKDSMAPYHQRSLPPTPTDHTAAMYMPNSQCFDQQPTAYAAPLPFYSEGLFVNFVTRTVNLIWHRREPSTTSNFNNRFQEILKVTGVSHSLVLLALRYMWTMTQRFPPCDPGPGSEYRSFVTALMLANKFLEDNTFTAKTWSQVTGISVHDLNTMEREFLTALNFSLHVSEEEYSSWYCGLLSTIPSLSLVEMITPPMSPSLPPTTSSPMAFAYTPVTMMIPPSYINYKPYTLPVEPYIYSIDYPNDMAACSMQPYMTSFYGTF
jgi:hypothetical protein